MKTQRRKNSNSRKYYSADVYNRESGPLEIGELETPSERWSAPVDAVLYLAGSKCRTVEPEETYSGEVSDFVDARSVESDGESSNEDESGQYYNREVSVERTNRSPYRNSELKNKQSDSNHSKHLSTLSSKFAQELKLRYATNAASNLHYQTKPIRDTFFHNMDYIHSQFTTYNPNYLNYRYGHFSYPNYPVVTHSEYYPSTFQSRCSPNCVNQMQNCGYCMPRVYPMNYDVCNKPENMYSRNSDNYFNRSSQNHQRYSDTHYVASQNNTSGSHYTSNVNYSYSEYTPRNLESCKDSKYFFDKYFYRGDSYQGLSDEKGRDREMNKRESRQMELQTQRDREKEYKQLEQFKSNEQYNYLKKYDSQGQKELVYNKYLESYYKGYGEYVGSKAEYDSSSVMFKDEDGIQAAIEKAVKNALENYLGSSKLNKGDETCLTDPVNREYTFDKNDATLTNEKQEQMYSTNYSESLNLSQYGQEQMKYKGYSGHVDGSKSTPTVSFDMKDRSKSNKDKENTNTENRQGYFKLEGKENESDSLQLSQYNYNENDKSLESVVFDLKKLADEIQKESSYLDSTFLERDKLVDQVDGVISTLDQGTKVDKLDNYNNNKESKENKMKKEQVDKENDENMESREDREYGEDKEDDSGKLVSNQLFDSQVSNGTELNGKQFDFESSFAKKGFVDGDELFDSRQSFGKNEMNLVGGLFDEKFNGFNKLKELDGFRDTRYENERLESRLDSMLERDTREHNYNELRKQEDREMSKRVNESRQDVEKDRTKDVQYYNRELRELQFKEKEERGTINRQMELQTRNLVNNQLDEQMTNQDDESDLLAGSEYQVDNYSGYGLEKVYNSNDYSFERNYHYGEEREYREDNYSNNINSSSNNQYNQNNEYQDNNQDEYDRYEDNRNNNNNGEYLSQDTYDNNYDNYEDNQNNTHHYNDNYSENENEPELSRRFEFMEDKGYQETNYYTSSSFNLNTFNSFSSLKGSPGKFNFLECGMDQENMNGTTLSTSDLTESRNFDIFNRKNGIDKYNNPFGRSNPFSQNSENCSVVSSNVQVLGREWEKDRELQEEVRRLKELQRDREYFSKNLRKQEDREMNKRENKSKQMEFKGKVDNNNNKESKENKNTKDRENNYSNYNQKDMGNYRNGECNLGRKEVCNSNYSNSEFSSYNKSQLESNDGVSLILDKVSRLEASLRKVESRLNSRSEDSTKSERNTEFVDGSPLKSPSTPSAAGVNQVSDVELMEGYKAASLIKKLLHVKSMDSLVPAFTAFLQNRRA